MIQENLICQLEYCRKNMMYYEQLISRNSSIIDSDIYFSCISLLIQVKKKIRELLNSLSYFEADRIHLGGETKFTARKYFDILLSNLEHIQEKELIPIIAGCLRTATKVLLFLRKQCQSQFISSLYTVEYAKAQCGSLVSCEFFQQIQQKILFLLHMKAKIVTPFSFLTIVKGCFPESEMSVPELTTIMDFYLTLPQIREYNSEEIFFSALLYFLSQKQSSPLCFKIAKALTIDWIRPMKMALNLAKKIHILTK